MTWAELDDNWWFNIALVVGGFWATYFAFGWRFLIEVRRNGINPKRKKD